MQRFQARGKKRGLLYPLEGGAMDDKRTRVSDRRQSKDMPDVPFRDSKGTIIRECRRKSPDRRIGNIHLEWISDYETW
jgi:hypothetical protein